MNKLLVILFIFIGLVISLIFIFLFQSNNEIDQSSIFETITINNTEYWKPINWIQYNSGSPQYLETVIFIPEGSLKYSKSIEYYFKWHPLNLDAQNSQVVHYLYDEGKSSSNIRERFFAEDNRWPRSSSFCDDLAFHYLYGLEDGLFAESIIKEYPYVSDQFSFNGTFTDLKNKYNLDEDIIKIRGICRVVGNIDENENKVQLYSILYIAREEVFNEKIEKELSLINPFDK